MTGQQLLVPSDSDIETLDDVKGLDGLLGDRLDPVGNAEEYLASDQLGGFDTYSECVDAGARPRRRR